MKSVFAKVVQNIQRNGKAKLWFEGSRPNQAFNADSLQRGILLRKILRPAANHSAGKPAPFCRLTWR